MVAVVWHTASVTRGFESQIEAVTSSEAKGRFDNMVHFSNNSLLLSGHHGTQTQLSGNVWWDEGEDKVPDEENFEEGILESIEKSYENYLTGVDRNADEVEIHLENSDTADGFKIEGTAELITTDGSDDSDILGTDVRKVKVYDTKSYEYTIKLRPFLLRDVSDELTNNAEEEILHPLEEEFEDAEKEEDEVEKALREELDDIEGVINGKYGPEEFEWNLTLSVENFVSYNGAYESELKIDVEAKDGKEGYEILSLDGDEEYLASEFSMLETITTD